MAWLISEALMRDYENSHYLQEQAAEYLADTCLDGEPLPPLNGPRIQLVYLPPDKMTDFCRLSRFGMMFKPLTDDRGADVLTWYRAGFHVRTSVQRDWVQELTERGQECGNTWRESLARYDRDLRLWKTPQFSLLGGLDEFSETWPRSGTMRNGCAYRLETVAHRMKGTGSGFWPTPCASDNRDRGNASTPAVARRIAKGKQVMLSMAVSTESGRLNPDWTEWLMGWPVGLTDLRPLGTDKFREWQQQHSLNLQDE